MVFVSTGWNGAPYFQPDPFYVIVVNSHILSCLVFQRQMAINKPPRQGYHLAVTDIDQLICCMLTTGLQ